MSGMKSGLKVTFSDLFSENDLKGYMEIAKSLESGIFK